jgi:hypothetical protein
MPDCFETAPQPVVMPHPSRQTLSSGALLLMATTDTSATTVYCEKVETPISRQGEQRQMIGLDNSDKAAHTK